MSAARCLGESVSFSVNATGTGLTYQWRKGGAPIPTATGTSYAIASVTATNAGGYDVIVAGNCGSTNSAVATLTVYESTTTSPMESLFRNLGQSAVFATTASGTGPFTYVWKKNGVVINGQSGSSLVLTNLGFADDGIYEVDVTGTCNTAIQSASLHIDIPPTVTIFSPTNGTVFFAPASFTLFADAQDPDGTISKVEFYSSANKLGETTNVVFYSTNLAAYAWSLTNLPPGTNIFTAVATDNDGAQGTSAPVSITILAGPPLTLIGAMTYDPLTDLFKQTVRVSNPTFSVFEAVRVYVTNLHNGTVVYNPSGSTNGIPFVQTQAPVPPGSYADLVIEFFSPLRLAPNPGLWAELVQPNTGGSAAALGLLQHINRGVRLPNGTFMVEFLTVANQLYSVEYSADLQQWKSAQQPFIPGNGTWIQWVDEGEPKTESAPAAVERRFYKVIQVQ
jgi:hypothetical protein